MQFKFDVLGAGDKVLAAWEGHFAVEHALDDGVEIYNYTVDENGHPRLGNDTILVCENKERVKKEQLDALDRLSHMLSDEEIEELEKHPIERMRFREPVGDADCVTA